MGKCIKAYENNGYCNDCGCDVTIGYKEWCGSDNHYGKCNDISQAKTIIHYDNKYIIDKFDKKEEE